MLSRSRISILLILVVVPQLLLAQNEIGKRGMYYKKMKALQVAIQKNLYDKNTGRYRATTDSSKWEVKNNYRRDYTYLWSLCSLFQADNEIEKIEKNIDLRTPLLKSMEEYYDDAPPKPGYSDYIMKLKPGERYYDDNQWIGITALNAYSRTKKVEDLKLGKLIYDFMMTGYDTAAGGGLYWKETSKSTKNTCSNGPGILVALQLYQITKEKHYLNTGLSLFNWANKTLKAPSNLYYDNVEIANNKIAKTIYSYNTGTMLESNIYLYECTREKKYLEEAKKIADSALDYFYASGKFRDGYWFNAVMLRAFQHLLEHDKSKKYIDAFKKCLDQSLENDQGANGLYTENGSELSLVEQGGMLEMLARYVEMQKERM